MRRIRVVRWVCGERILILSWIILSERWIDRGGMDYRLVEHMLHPLPCGLESPWLGSLHLSFSWLSLAVSVFRDPLFT